MHKFAIKVDGREFKAEFPDSIAAVRATFAAYQGARSVVVRAVAAEPLYATCCMEANRAELLAEDIECLHMALDKAGVPRADDGGNTYSLWGRVIRFKNEPSNAALTGAEGVRVEGTVMQQTEE